MISDRLLASQLASEGFPLEYLFVRMVSMGFDWCAEQGVIACRSCMPFFLHAFSQLPIKYLMVIIKSPNPHIRLEDFRSLIPRLRLVLVYAKCSHTVSMSLPVRSYIRGHVESWIIRRLRVR